MSKIIVFFNLTLDGVMQALSGAAILDSSYQVPPVVEVNSS
jgi:hypothetical protein